MAEGKGEILTSLPSMTAEDTVHQLKLSLCIFTVLKGLVMFSNAVFIIGILNTWGFPTNTQQSQDVSLITSNRPNIVEVDLCLKTELTFYAP